MTGPQTLPGALRHAATAYADRVAVVDGETTMTWSALHARAQATARGYVALGAKPGDRIAIWAPNTWHWIVASLAITYMGATLVPLNTRYRGAEVADVIDRTNATLVIVSDGFLNRSQLDELNEAAGELPRASELGAEGDVLEGLPRVRAVIRIGEGAIPGTVAFDEVATLGESIDLAQVEAMADAVTPDDVADILFTSGTTGRSKGVLTAHSQTIAAAVVWSTNGQVTSEDRYLLINPFFHSYGYKVGILTGVLTGCSLYPAAAFDAEKVLAMIETDRITVLPGAPAVFHSMMESPAFDTTDTSSLRFANTGSSVIPVALIERMQSVLNFKLVSTAYGMTECVMGTMCREGDSDELVATTNGRAVTGLEVRIADPDTGEPRPAGVEGEVLTRGPMVMLGYLDDEAATAEAIDADGWLHTGDIGALDDQGYLRITDRLKDMYISGGFNVYPAEVEQALDRLEGVLESAVVGVPDERMGEVGKAFVVRREGATLTEDDVIAFARERLANFKSPRHVEFVSTLPRNLSGKILKNDLRTGSAATKES